MMTVLIATHNGADTLGRTLQRLTEIEAPPGGWKLVVVNNASTDGTKDIILGHRATLPLEYLEEQRLGKSYALNRGMDHAEGDLLVCSDDDVLPARDWLVQWRSGADRHPDASLFGGTIEPLYEAPPPSWLAKTVWAGMFFAQTNPNLPEGEIADTVIFGPNMGLRTVLVENGARFAESFGPVARSGLMGDEIEFTARLLREGHKMCFLPRAKVQHIVQKGQLTWRWMLKRCYRHGGTMFAFEKIETAREFPQILGVPRYLIRRVGERLLMLPLVALRLNSFALFAHLRGIAYDLGAINQARMGKSSPGARETALTHGP
jgi:glycosyltransferase involved in cell wall biosynthesis